MDSKANGNGTANGVTRVTTGIAGLDNLLQGGFLPGRTYLFTGDAGTGKTTACMQFLMAGLQQGEKAVYVTVDERPTEILQSATSLEWDLQKHVQEKTLVILDASPYFSGRGVTDKGIDVSKFVTDLAGYTNKLEAVRLVIDPVTPLIVSADSPWRVHENARMLIHLLQTNLTTTNLLTSHLPATGDHGAPTQGIEEFLAAGVMILSVGQSNERLARTLGVKKMRGTAVDPCEYPFAIVKNKGIVLLPAPVPVAPSPSAEPSKKAIIVEDVTFQGLEFFELPKS